MNAEEVAELSRSALQSEREKRRPSFQGGHGAAASSHGAMPMHFIEEEEEEGLLHFVEQLLPEA